MHEYTVMVDLVDRILTQLPEDGARRVASIRLRRGSTFAEAPLRQAFDLVARGTRLEEASLEIEEFAVEAECARCHQRHRISADDLIGHIFLCPDCGEAREIDEAHGVELVGVSMA